MLAVRNDLGEKAAQDGYDSVRLMAHRTENSTAGSPGKEIDMIISLDRWR